MLCFQDAMAMPLQQLLGSWRSDAIPLGLQMVAVAHSLLPKQNLPPLDLRAVGGQVRDLAAMPCDQAVVVCPSTSAVM